MTIAQKLFVVCLRNKDLNILSKIDEEWLEFGERKQYKFIRDYLREHGELPDVEVFTSKYKLEGKASGRSGYYLAEVKDRYIAAQIADNIPMIMAKMKDSPVDAVDSLRDFISGLKLATTRSGIVDYSEDAEKRYLAYKEAAEKEGIRYISTGIDAFDKTFHGYREADLVTLAGRSGMKKTWCLLYMCTMLEQWMNTQKEFRDREILLVTNEMPVDEIIERLDCIRFGLNYDLFLKGELERSDLRRYREGLKTLSESPSKIRIVHNINKVNELLDIIMLYKPLKVYIDGSYLMESQMEYNWQKISYITGSLKKVAKDTKTPITNTTQLGRGKGKDDKSSLDAQEEFAFGSSFVNDSDIALRMYTDKYLEAASQIGINVAKGRRVPPGTKFVFNSNLYSMDLSIVQDTEPPLETIVKF